MGGRGEGERTGSFVLRSFICFLKAGILREISGGDLNRIFIRFIGMSFRVVASPA